MTSKRETVACAALVLSGLVVLGALYPIALLPACLGLGVVYLISIAFDWKSRLPFARRIGIAYLAFAAITYLLPGYLGFNQYARWLENDIWSRLISPYPNDGGFQDTECCALVEGAEYHVGTHRMVPESPHDEASTLIIAVSLVAIAGAFLMARSKPLGYYIWVCIIACSIVRFSYYLFMGIKF